MLAQGNMKYNQASCGSAEMWNKNPERMVVV